VFHTPYPADEFADESVVPLAADLPLQLPQETAASSGAELTAES